MSSTGLHNIAIYGAGGDNIGHHVLKSLLSKPDQFTVSVLARASSKTTFTDAVKVIRLPDLPSHEDYVVALRGQDALISAVGYPAKLEEPKIIDAAVEAGVKRFIPSEYGLDNSQPVARQLNAVFAAKGDVIDYLKTKESEGLTWTSVPTGLWLDWCISLVPIFAGIDAKAHTAQLWNDGKHRTSFTTLPWAAEAIAQILRNPKLTKNKIFPVRAFEASQREVVAALEKVQGLRYEISQVDGKKQIEVYQQKWAEGDTHALLPLLQAGFLLPGYGSNLVEEGVLEIGSDKLDLPIISLDSVVQAAVKTL